MVKNQKDALEELLAIAPSKVQEDLILQLVTDRPDIRRECFEFLKTHVSLSDELEKKSEGEVMWALWCELDPDLSDLDKYGGGDYDTVDNVADLLYQIEEQLDSKNVDSDCRRDILDLVLPYIESGNAGMDDMLYDENRWNVFAAKVKQYNIRRPAFQDEFAKIVPGWRELN